MKLVEYTLRVLINQYDTYEMIVNGHKSRSIK